jgi:isopropylmalate/homocitrate/citramalate synthase
MITPRESLDTLVRDPRGFTSHLKFPEPASIVLYDDTLRDGEQMPGVAFSPAQKLELAGLLADVGIDVMDVAFPVVSDSDRIALRLILEARRDGRIRESLDVLAMCRAVPGDVDAVLDVVAQAGVLPRDVSILILSTTSDLHLKYKLGRTLLKREDKDEAAWLDTPVSWYRDANIRLITDAIRYASSRGIERIEFAAEDASRSDIAYTIAWAQACIAAGGTRFCFSDTCGVFSPEAVDRYFPPIVEALGVRQGRVQLTAHFHNDFGLGAINTVRAVLHGATHPSVTANGIGERAGNTSIHQFVMVLRDLYGVTLPRFRYDRLHELRGAVERASGIAIQAHEPIVGEGVFSHESGIHAAAILIHPAIYQVIRERDVGGTQRFVFGKHSGAAAVEAVLNEHRELLAANGVTVDATLVARVLDRVKELRDAQTHDGRATKAVRDFYANYSQLGIGEAALVELAIERTELVERAGTEVTKGTGSHRETK